MRPSTAEYWHIGAMMMRFRSSTFPTFNGVNSFAVAMRFGSGSASGEQLEPGDREAPVEAERVGHLVSLHDFEAYSIDQLALGAQHLPVPLVGGQE